MSRRYTDLELYRRLLRETRGSWWMIAALFGLGLLATPLALLTPLPLKIAVDSVLESHPPPAVVAWIFPPLAEDTWRTMLLTAVLLVVGVALVDQLRQLAHATLNEYAGRRLVVDFRARLFSHVQRLSLAYHDARGTADALYRIQNDTWAVQWMALDGLAPVVTSAVTVASMLYVTARLDWHLALVAVAVCPLLGAITWFSRRPLRTGWRTVKELDSGAIAVVQEALASLRVVKAFGQEDREQARFTQRADEGLRARVRVAFVNGLFGMAFTLVTACGTALVLWIGVRQVQYERLTVGELLLVMSYLAQLYHPARQVSKTVANMQSAIASAERSFTLLDESPDVVERPNARRLGRAAGHLALRQVSFAYNGDDLVLHEVSVDVPAGTRLGIMGVTGAGKTTLISLLSRFYDPQGGEILLDGVDLRDYRVADLRRQFGIVLQEPVLFSTTIAENIAYARANATAEEIIAAARAAHAHEFVSRLPAGYQTLVGERGMRLSGGERQRISLARAFLKDAPILVLDEPTSAVDVETEEQIMEALQRLLRGRTTLLITHRLATLQQCERVVKLERGRLLPVDRDAIIPARRAGECASPAADGAAGQTATATGQGGGS